MRILHKFALLSLTVLASPVLAASEDDILLARQFLRCAAFYVAGAQDVKRDELRRQLQDLANRSLYNAELLLDRDRPLVKQEFAAARTKFAEEARSEEARADGKGFLKFMGGHCRELQARHQARLPLPAAK